MAMVQFQSLFPAQYLCMHISGTSHNGSSRSIQVSCKSSNKWPFKKILSEQTLISQRATVKFYIHYINIGKFLTESIVNRLAEIFLIDFSSEIPYFRRRFGANICQKSTFFHDGFKSTKFTQLVKDVKYALRTEDNNRLDNLALVDALQRIGIEYHFQEEIELLLQKEYAESACFLKYQSPFEVSLCFRLLRQEDVFKKFKNNDDGAFGLNLNQNVSGLIGLYEAAQLGIEGEHILDELANFSGKHLKACLAHNDSCGQARIIKETLEYPYHKTLASFKAKIFINNFKGINGWGRSTLQELAIIDYSVTQEIHQHELAQVSR